MNTPTYLIVISVILVITTFIPLIRHDFWTFRVFEYPRLQKLVINVVLLLAVSFSQAPTIKDFVLIALLACNFLYLCYQIYPFTVIGKKQIISTPKTNPNHQINMLIANVYQDNRDAASYHKLIAHEKPDLILMVETNKWWQNQMDQLEKDYPYTCKAPLENTYGMLLYSKLELIDAEIKYLVEEDIPSIDTRVKLKSGELVQLYCLHPTPPVPQENPRSTERDKEILLVAKKAKASTLPVIVVGDLNDVAWSYTTELFVKTSELLDPRRGRGFYNSFHAKYFFLRFPLDHVFCSTDFTLGKLKRLPNCNSDHFPIGIQLQLDKHFEHHNETLEADADDLELAQEKIEADT